MTLAADLARYGTAAQWKGVYSRGEKIGFLVGQTVPTDDGYDLQEDGRLQMTLLGASTAAQPAHLRHVSRDVPAALVPVLPRPRHGRRSQSRASVDGRRCASRVTTPSRDAQRDARAARAARALPQPVAPPRRRRAAARACTSKLPVFDPATLRNAPMIIDVEAREVVRAADRPVPAFKVRTQLRGDHVHVVDHRRRRGGARGEPAGLHGREGDARSARCPSPSPARCRPTCSSPPPSSPTRRARIDDPASVQRLRMRLTGVDLASARTCRGTGRRSPATCSRSATRARARPSERADEPRRVPRPRAVHRERRARDRRRGAQRGRGGRHGHAGPGREADPLRERPAGEEADGEPALRARGPAHEGRRLQRAHRRSTWPWPARSAIPARIAVGLVYLRGAFYYHAWPEVYVAEGRRARAVAARRSHPQPVPRRRHARPAGPRRPRPAGRHPAP